MRGVEARARVKNMATSEEMDCSTFEWVLFPGLADIFL